MKHLARKFSQSAEPAWSEKGAIVQVEDNAAVTSTPGRRVLPIDAARYRGASCLLEPRSRNILSG